MFFQNRRSHLVTCVMLLSGLLWLGCFARSAAALAQDHAASLRYVQAIRTQKLGILHPTGLAFSPQATLFFVLEAPRPTQPAATDTGLILLTPSRDLAGVVPLAAALTAPINLAFDSRVNRLLFLDPATDALLELTARPDGHLEPTSLTRYDARPFGLQNPQGMTVDPVSGHLFILDGAPPRLVRVAPELSHGFARAAIATVDLAHLGVGELRGLALDPTTGHLHVVAPVAHQLYELTETGQVVAIRDLTAIALRTLQGMVFAPSSDLTDDPSQMSLFVADSGLDAQRPGQILELSLTQAPEASLAQAAASAVSTVTSSLIRIIDTSRFSPPSPDPSGIEYLPATGTLLVSDGEVEEMSIFAGKNLFEMTLSGSLVATHTTTTPFFSNEPVGVAYNPTNGHLFISDDNQREVFEINPGSDGLLFTTDDIRTSFDTTAFGSNDPEGLAFDTWQSVLFIADGVNSEVYRIAPGANGIFDGVDDQVTHFDTASLGVTDPEGIAFNADNGHLYIVGRPVTTILEVMTDGTVVRLIDISAANAKKPAGLAYAPSSVDPLKRSIYIADRGVDNNDDPNENDGKVYEMSVPPLTEPPPEPGGESVVEVRIAAGSDDAEEKASGSVSLTGSDLELVVDGTVTQTVGLRFPGVAIPQGAIIVTAYVQFQVDETSSGPTSLTLQGEAVDQAAPFTTASRNLSSRPRTTAAVGWTPPDWTTVGAAGSAQQTPELAPVIQEIVGRPVWVSGNALALIITGTGRRVAESYEGKPTGAPLLHVEFTMPDQARPVVDAGLDQTIALPKSTALQGTVIPSGVTTTWSQVSGPGAVTFDDATALKTTASFTVSGIYVLRLTADDGQLAAFDEVTITVTEADGTIITTTTVRITVGADDAEESASGSVSLTGSDLELVVDGTVTQTVGLRFPGVTIPRGATIVEAYVQFQVDETSSGATTLTIQGEAVDNAAAFTKTSRNLSNRLPLDPEAAAVEWTLVPAWPTVGAAGLDQRTPNLAPVIQEIVGRSGWVSGNALALLITGTGRRVAESREGSATGAPLLSVKFMIAP